MEKTYDQRCPDCETCGWHGDGNYPDGRPYDKCEWYGYILHDTVMAKCEGYMTGRGVEEFKNQYNRRKKK